MVCRSPAPLSRGTGRFRRKAAPPLSRAIRNSSTINSRREPMSIGTPPWSCRLLISSSPPILRPAQGLISFQRACLRLNSSSLLPCQPTFIYLPGTISNSAIDSLPWTSRLNPTKEKP